MCPWYPISWCQRATSSFWCNSRAESVLGAEVRRCQLILRAELRISRETSGSKLMQGLIYAASYNGASVFRNVGQQKII
jgi:hypothetical protein